MTQRANPQGNTVGTVAAHVEVQYQAALLKTGALQNAILNSANFSSIATDEKGVIQIFNVGAERMLGYTAADVVNKITTADISDPQEVIARAKALSLELGTPITPGLEALVFKASRGIEDIYELTYIRKDGSRFPAIVSVTALRDAQGAILGYLLIGTDNTARKQAEETLRESEERFITERKRAEEKIKQYNEQLEAANKELEAFSSSVSHDLRKTEDQLRQSLKMEALGRLAGGVAHDFNNMLTLILGYSQILLKALGTDSPLSQDVLEIKHAGERSASLTRQLLAFSRKQVLQPRVLDLNGVVTNFESMLRRVIGEDITLRIVLSPGLRCVKVDAGQMEQVVMNLVVNARDAMPDGGTLTIETANVELDDAFVLRHKPMAPGRYVMLAVSDTGCGMDYATQAHIFDPFFTTKELGQGTGLGLSTVFGIIKQSDGYIWVDSEPGQGAAFKIYLPHAEEAAEMVAPVATGATSHCEMETILLVEDEKEVRAMICRILQQEGYTVLEAGNSQEAFLHAGQHKNAIHLLVTDLVMRGMNGRELAERMKSSHPDMKVLLVSGYTGDAIARHGVLAKGVNFLEKPFTAEGLTSKVRGVLDTNP